MPRLRWVVFMGAVLLVAFIVGTVYFFEFQKISRLKTALITKESLLEEKKLTVYKLKEKIKFYKTQEGLAHLAREQYNLLLPGEKLFVIESVE